MPSNSSVSLLSRPLSLVHLLLRSTLDYLLDRMGNWWGSSNQPAKVEHPKLIGKLPPPDAISKINPELLVYSDSPHECSLLLNSKHSPAESVELLKPHLVDVQRLVVLTHGFQNHKNTSWLHALKVAILKANEPRRLKQLVIILGWGDGANLGLIWYAQAAANCIETGKWLGSFLKAFREAHPDIETYAVGHSLGAHLVGMAGKTSNVLDRITGLDPAGVGFQDVNIDKRLSRTDALLVDVIHTDGQDVPYFGTLVPLGLIDFYPNYGWNQPANDRIATQKPDQTTEFDANKRKIPQQSQYGGSISESHSRAVEFFTWSVSNSKAFKTNLRLDGQPEVEKAVHRVITTGTNGDAEVTVEMGYHCDAYIEAQIAGEDQAGGHCVKPKVIEDITKYDGFAGCFYVHTNATAPWC